MGKVPISNPKNPKYYNVSTLIQTSDVIAPVHDFKSPFFTDDTMIMMMMASGFFFFSFGPFLRFYLGSSIFI